MKKDVYRFHAEVCRSIAHPKRLEILNLLREGERSVGELAQVMEISPTNVSQQLAVLRNAGVVRRRMEGTTAHYGLTDDRVLRAYDLMSQVMEEQLAARSSALGKVRRTSRTSRRKP